MSDKLKECPKITKIKGDNETKSVVLSWSEVEGAEKYAIKRSEGDKGEYEHIAWTKKLKFTDDTIEPYKMYHYKITAWKKLEGKKTSTKTSSAKAVIVSDVKVPKNVSVIPDNGGIKIKWDKVKEAFSYVVLRRNSLCTDLLPVATVKGCSFYDEDIVSGQPYYYGVQTVNKNGDEVKPGKWSKQLSAVHLDCGQILSLKNTIGKNVHLSFRIVAGADGYIIERSEKKDTEFVQVGKNDGQVSVEYSEKVPKSFKTYYYRVKAYKTVENEQFVSMPSKVDAIKVCK